MRLSINIAAVAITGLMLGSCDNAKVSELEAKVASLESTRTQEAANKKLVRRYFSGDMPPEERANILHKDYIQHSPPWAKYAAKYNLTGFEVNKHLMPVVMAAQAEARAKADPNAPKPPAGEPVSQMIAEGDLVFMMRTIQKPDPTEAPGTFYPAYTWELLRIKDGKFYEHWDHGTINLDDPWNGTPPPVK